MRIVFIIYLLILVCSADIPRLWTRIDEGLVGYKVIDFININKINNCFEYVETPTHLKLKCWRDNKLTNVELKILDSKKKNEKIHFYIEPAESVWI